MFFAAINNQLPIRRFTKVVCGSQLAVRSPRVATLVLFLFLLPIHGCKPRELVRPTPQMGIDSRYWVRVLLLDDVTGCALKAPSLLTVSSGTTDLASQTSLIRSARRGARQSRVKIEVSAGQITIAGRSFAGSEVLISPDKPYIFGLEGEYYRGKLKLVVNPDGQSFDAINLVPLEAYLAGVVGAEMPDYWEPEALKAQAIAARTYCLYVKDRFGNRRSWDVSKTQASQVYYGIGAESAQVWNAVADTYGKVVISKNPNVNVATEFPNMSDQLFPAYYSSACGGHTENSEHVFGDSFEPLAGVPCPYCKDVAKLSVFFWPMVQVDAADVTSRLVRKYPKLKELGDIVDVVAAEKSDYGEFSRLTKVKLIGSTGKDDVLRAEDLRLTIDPTGRKIRSTACNIVKWGDKWAFLSGRGWGHGAGMCQCGAEGLARQGKNAVQILSHYYPGSEIVSIY